MAILFCFVLCCLLIPELPMKIADHNVAEHGKEGILQSELVQDELRAPINVELLKRKNRPMPSLLLSV